jgi:DNA-directed RNA polymerase delta subunit
LSNAAVATKAEKSVAVHYLEDLLFEQLLRGGQAAKSSQLAGEIEAVVNLHPKFVRKVLLQGERFAPEERRWNLALRVQSQLPLEGAVEYALRSYGKPMSQEALGRELALAQRRPPELVEGLLPRALRDRDKYFDTPRGEWGLSEWLLDLSGEDPEEVFLRNFLGEVETARETVEELLDTRMSADQPEGVLAAKLIRKAERPLSNRALSYALWRLQEGKLEPARLFEELRKDERLVLLSGAIWTLQEYQEDYLRELRRLSRRAEQEEDAGLAEEEEPEGPITVLPADLEEVLRIIEGRKRPVRMPELAEAVFEVSVSSRRFGEMMEALREEMERDSRFLRVGSQTWGLPEMMPKDANVVPGSLLVVSLDTSRLEEEEVDAELEDDGLDPGLSKLVHDPHYEDFGEEPEIELSPEKQPTEELRYSLLYDHWKARTLKVRICDRRFYPSESELVCASFIDKKVGTFPVWLSYRTSLLYELGDWYQAHKMGPGSVFRIRPGEARDEFLVSYKGEMDKLVAIPPERIGELEALQKEAEEKEWSVFDLMCRLMTEHRKGISFLLLWAEVNVVRRTTRRVVASNLSSYHSFYQRPAGSDRWVFDERKLGQGRKKTKKKYVRKREI